MDSIFLSSTILLHFHLVMAFLLLAIFSSLIVRRKIIGSIFLVFLLFLEYANLKKLFDYSPIMGLILCFLYLCLGIATYFNIKRKEANKFSG